MKILPPGARKLAACTRGKDRGSTLPERALLDPKKGAAAVVVRGGNGLWRRVTSESQALVCI